MPAYIYILLFVIPFLGGMIHFLLKRSNRLFLKLLLSFSGSYLFCISVLHILPEIYKGPTNNIGLYILGGFFFQILLEFFSEGIEHGHIHVHKHATVSFPLTIMISLCAHSLLEGMPLPQMFHQNDSFNSFLAGIVLHHIPVAFALMSMLIESKVSRITSVVCLAVFALMSPLGAGISYMLNASLVADLAVYSDRLMGIVVGIFLHISTTILFESSENHRFNLYKFITIIIGAALAINVSF